MNKSKKIFLGCILLSATLVGCSNEKLVTVNPNYGTDEGLLCDATNHWSLANGQVSNSQAHKFSAGVCSDCGYIESSSQNLTFELNDKKDGYIVTKATKDVKQVTIPNYYNNLPVTAIGNNAFFNNQSLVYVGFPNSLTTIGRASFSGCKSLESINLSNNIVTIAEQAFATCSSLSSLTLPSNLKSLSWRSFYGCSSLSSVTLPEGFTTLENSAFYGCIELTNINIPSSIEKVGLDSFTRCNKISYTEYENGLYLGNDEAPYSVLVDVKDDTVETLLINDATKVIGPNAVRDLKLVKTVSVPNGLVSISDYGFQGCTVLENISLPTSLTSIGDSGFAFCNALTEVTVPAGTTSIGKNAFYSCVELTNVSLPNTLKSIGADAFTLSNKVVYNTIEDGYYLGNSSNEALVLIKPVSEEKIQSFNINSNTRIIGPSAFEKQDELTSISIPSSVVTIAKSAFASCRALPEISIPSNVETIDESAFYACGLIEKITLSEGLKVIGASAFANCVKVASLTLPSGIEKIGNKAFTYCLALAEINIPNTVSYIGDSAFAFANSEIVIKCQAYSKPLGWSDTALPTVDTSASKHPEILWGQN